MIVTDLLQLRDQVVLTPNMEKGIEFLLNLGADDHEEEPEADSETSTDEDAVLAELRDELAAQFGDRYVIHTYSGMENRVKQNLDARIQTLGMEDYIFETVVPTEEVVEIRNNARKTVTRCVLPGYVLIRMELTDDSWSVVRQTPSVTGFVGHGQQPVALSIDEVLNMLTPSVIATVNAAQAGAAVARRKKVEVVDFAVGDSVMVVHGPAAFDAGDVERLMGLLCPRRVLVAGVMARTAAEESGLPVTCTDERPSRVLSDLREPAFLLLSLIHISEPTRPY